MDEKLLELCKKIMGYIVEGKYEELENMNAFKAFTCEALKEIISGYMEANGFEKIVFPPEEKWQELDPIEYTAGGYHVDIDLWMDDEWSDLTLMIDVDTDYSFVIENCHIL